MASPSIPDLKVRAHLKFAEVALDRPIDRALTYSIPPALAGEVHVGSIVEAPLRGKPVRGVVTALADQASYRGPLLAVRRLLTPDYTINEELMALGRWLAEYYCCSLGEALGAVSFVGLNDVHARMKSHLALAAPEHWVGVSRDVGPEGRKVTSAHARVLQALLAESTRPCSAAELCDLAGVGQGVLQTMIKRQWLVRVLEPELREDDYPRREGEPDPPHEPTPDQARAIEALLEPLRGGRYRSFVLNGVTGSGKTEVYLRAIEECLRMGRTALVLVPEIALTPQTVEVFRGRFGSLVGVYHSRLTLGQKYDLWRRIVGGEARVLIGTRSAVFAPLPSLGLIAVDEEHEATYKQNETPRYHARDVAVWRAARQGAVVVLGSATPSLESYYNAREGKYTLLEMRSRIGPHAAATMTVIDMKLHLAEGRPTPGLTMITPILQKALGARLEAGEQSVLLLNRRGFANQVLCLGCEKVLGCPDCDVALTYHKPFDRMICHWCGHNEPLPEVCPKCGLSEIQKLGLGTQRIEEVLGSLMPEARLIRVDVDSMKGRRSFIEAWERISRGEVDIILGTQMIAKGFHLEAVTLVGVISADFSLFLPDFRSAERTYQLLTQVAGRAGRGERPGEVIVQTYIPRHYAIEHAARLDEAGFYRRELHMRRMLRFPPISRLIAVLASGEDPTVVRQQISRLAHMMKSLARRPAYRELQVLGPAPAPIGKLQGRYRWRVLLRGPGSGALHEILAQGLRAFEPVHRKTKVAITIDVDPVNLM